MTIKKTIIRNTVDLNANDRTALERVLGDNQQLVIGIVSLPGQRQTPEPPPSRSTASAAPALPDWCNVYDGLSDEEIADLERIILQRADLSRPS
jgi:hypothetical protein